MADDDKWKKFQQWRDAGAGSPTAGQAGGGSWMGSAWAGVKGAGKEIADDFGAGTSKDPEHPTAEWVGRTAADWAPIVGFDAVAPEVALPAAAARYAPRVASLVGKGLTGAYKGAVGGAAMQPQNTTRGGATGAEAGTAASLARAGWGMLPGWAKYAAVSAPGTLAGLASLAHEMGADGRYISPWAMHHAVSALGALAGAAAGGPATSGAATSAIQNTLDPQNGGK